MDFDLFLTVLIVLGVVVALGLFVVVWRAVAKIVADHTAQLRGGSDANARYLEMQEEHLRLSREVAGSLSEIAAALKENNALLRGSPRD